MSSPYTLIAAALCGLAVNGAAVTTQSSLSEESVRAALETSAAVVDGTVVACVDSVSFHRAIGYEEPCSFRQVRIDRVYKGYHSVGDTLTVATSDPCGAEPIASSLPVADLRVGNRCFLVLKALPWTEPIPLWVSQTFSTALESGRNGNPRVRIDGGGHSGKTVLDVLREISREFSAAVVAERSDVALRGRIVAMERVKVSAIVQESYRGPQQVGDTVAVELSAPGSTEAMPIRSFETGDHVILLLSAREGRLQPLEDAGVYSAWIVDGDAAEVRHRYAGSEYSFVVDRVGQSEIEEILRSLDARR